MKSKVFFSPGRKEIKTVRVALLSLRRVGNLAITLAVFFIPQRGKEEEDDRNRKTG